MIIIYYHDRLKLAIVRLVASIQFSIWVGEEDKIDIKYYMNTL